jgi:hypothetical protein
MPTYCHIDNTDVIENDYGPYDFPFIKVKERR